MSSKVLCKICNKVEFKYSCPKCDIVYCSLGCYKSPEHQKCSEEFYKKCIEDELSASARDKESSEDIKKMYDILSRASQQLDNDHFDLGDGSQELDSDDDDEVDADDIATRLEGVDINDSDDIWNHLTDVERNEFQAMIKSGEIMNLLPKYQPWWSLQSTKLVVPLSEVNVPKVLENIPPLSMIYSKEPPPCIHNNLWNVITSYACTVKYFNGEHQTNSWEAANYFVALSANLKRNDNFDDAEKAVVSVQIEALEENIALPCEEFTEIQKDSRQIMSAVNFKSVALSDAIVLLKVAKDQEFGKDCKKKTREFNKKFESKLLAGLSKSKLNLVIKKIEFFLSFIGRDCK